MSDPFLTARFGGSRRTATCASATSTDGTTVLGSRSERATSSSAQVNKSSFVRAWEMLCSRGECPDIERTDKTGSSAVSSETKGSTSRRSLSDRLTLSLISRGLVCGITPSLTRKQSGQPILVLALDTPGGSDAESRQEGSSFSNYSQHRSEPQP